MRRMRKKRTKRRSRRRRKIRVRFEVGPQFPTWGHCASFTPSPSDQHRKRPQVKPTERRRAHAASAMGSPNIGAPARAHVPWGGVLDKMLG